MRREEEEQERVGMTTEEQEQKKKFPPFDFSFNFSNFSVFCSFFFLLSLETQLSELQSKRSALEVKCIALQSEVKFFERENDRLVKV